MPESSNGIEADVRRLAIVVRDISAILREQILEGEPSDQWKSVATRLNSLSIQADEIAERLSRAADDGAPSSVLGEVRSRIDPG